MILYFACPTAQIFYLIWRETLQAATSTGSGLKGNRLIHLLCKFHARACYPWQVIYMLTFEFFKTIYLEASNTQFGSFSHNPVT